MAYTYTMTDAGTHLVVDAGEKGLEDLLEIVRQEGRVVRICVGGEAVAELSPPSFRRLGPVDPRLKATILVEGHEVTTEDDWPQESR